MDGQYQNSISTLPNLGVYRYEIAEQKIVESTDMARNHGYPLVLKAEAE